MWHPCWSGMVVAIATQRRVARSFDSWFLAEGNWLDSYLLLQARRYSPHCPWHHSYGFQYCHHQASSFGEHFSLFSCKGLGYWDLELMHYVRYIYVSLVSACSIMCISKSWDSGYWIVHIFNRWEGAVQLMTLFSFVPEALTGEIHLLTW